MWFVYVLQSQKARYSKVQKCLPGLFYVGCTTDVARRVKQHNGLLSGGARCTRKSRPWILQKVYGTYANRGEAQRAEYALKHSKRGEGRLHWSSMDSTLCRIYEEDDGK